MKLSKLVGERTKETPTSATVKSQALLMRAGYIKQVSNGIYSMLTPAQKVSVKIQNIIKSKKKVIFLFFTPQKISKNLSPSAIIINSRLHIILQNYIFICLLFKI